MCAKPLRYRKEGIAEDRYLERFVAQPERLRFIFRRNFGSVTTGTVWLAGFEDGSKESNV